MKVEKNSIVLTFDHAGKALRIEEHSAGNEFQISAEDSAFKPALVRVRGKTLVVSHPEMARPVAVRYGFSDAPQATLFNSAGLPASPFRTDTW
jgi:sialate O-acetylesterase